jgi:hypothetical protein
MALVAFALLLSLGSATPVWTGQGAEEPARSLAGTVRGSLPTEVYGDGGFAPEFALGAQPGSVTPLWEPHEDLADDAQEPEPTVAREVVRELRIGDFRIVLESTPMSAAQQRLGGSLGQRGDAATHLEWICRTGSDASAGWVVWLEAGEIHGDYVGGFEWRRIAKSSLVDPRCSTALPGEQVSLPVQLRLGMTERELIAILGRPTSHRGDTLVFAHEHPDSKEPQYVVSNYLDVVIDQGIVAAIRVWRVTSD